MRHDTTDTDGWDFVSFLGDEEDEENGTAGGGQFADIWGQARESVDYLCKGLALAPSRGKISIIAGEPGAAKGPLAAHLAVCFALGRPVLGVHEVRQARVLYLDFEGVALTCRRIERIAASMGATPDDLGDRVLVFDASGYRDATRDDFQAGLRRFVTERGIEVVILDTYTSAVMGSDRSYRSPRIAYLAAQLGLLGLLVIALDRPLRPAAGRAPRFADMAGDGALVARAQTVIFLHYPDPDDKHTVAVTCARAPGQPFPATHIRWTDPPAECVGGAALAVSLVTP